MGSGPEGKGRTYEVVYAAAGVVWGSSPCLSERQRKTGDGDSTTCVPTSEALGQN